MKLWKTRLSEPRSGGSESRRHVIRIAQQDLAWRVGLNDDDGPAYRIGQADLKDIRNADGLFAVVNGCPPDEGVMVELGMAISLNKPTFLFRDDIRRCTDCETYPVNLMLFTGLPATGWEEYWYSSVEEITDPRKALARWVSGKEPAAARTRWR